MTPKLLFTPGPTTIPESVLHAMSRARVHHRTPEFEAVFAVCTRDLASLVDAKEPAVLLAGAGTLAMEASVTNFLRRGQRALVLDAGKFGRRWSAILAAYGVACDVITTRWGDAVDPDAVRSRLREGPEIAAVYCTTNESSTGTWHPIDAIAAVVRESSDALVIVDAVSSIGAIASPVDAWGIDVLVGASQKALMGPPGLAFVVASERAWDRATTADLPRFYANLLSERTSQREGKSAGTPAIPQVFALAEALRLIGDEGVEAVYARHALCAEALRAGCRALGLELLSRSPSNTVTAIVAPDGRDSDAIVRLLRDRFGIVIASGQDELKGRVFRIGHLGQIQPIDVVTVLGALALVLDRGEREAESMQAVKKIFAAR